LYLLGDGAVANARPGIFADALFFSVETLSTIGYGQMSPATFYGNAVMTVEAATG
jgi:inward rectifier potassium channel